MSDSSKATTPTSTTTSTTSTNASNASNVKKNDADDNVVLRTVYVDDVEKNAQFKFTYIQKTKEKK
jgi:Tfp pilus assembly protein FimT